MNLCLYTLRLEWILEERKAELHDLKDRLIAVERDIERLEQELDLSESLSATGHEDT